MLCIPFDAQLIKTNGNKWRASKAYVASITDLGGNGYDSCISSVHSKREIYVKGSMVYPDGFDPSPTAVCSRGIHCHEKKEDCDQWFN